MGAKLAVVGIVLLGAGLQAASVYASAFFAATTEQWQGRHDVEERLHDQARGRIAFVTHSCAGSDTTLDLTNTGGVTFRYDRLAILGNGIVQTGFNIKSHSIDGNTATNVWPPDTTLQVVLETDCNTFTRVLVVTETGARAYREV